MRDGKIDQTLARKIVRDVLRAEWTAALRYMLVEMTLAFGDDIDALARWADDGGRAP